MSALLVAVLVLGGIGVYIVRYIEHGAEWATFAANSSVYTSGVLSTGTLTDRSGVVLATANGGSRSYADDAAVRTACYQAVGDYTGNIGTGALKAFSKQLSGYNPITGTYATDGHTVALTLDSSLCVTAYEALAGRKGAVLVSNYKTGEILCMASGPSIDPSSDGDVPDILQLFLVAYHINMGFSGRRNVHAGTDVADTADSFLEDFYITKPFSMRELLARVKANIRRNEMVGRVWFHKRSRKLQRSRHDSRAGAYELAHSKSFPAMLVGSRIVVPKDRLSAWVDRKVSERI